MLQNISALAIMAVLVFAHSLQMAHGQAYYSKGELAFDKLVKNLPGQTVSFGDEFNGISLGTSSYVQFSKEGNLETVGSRPLYKRDTCFFHNLDDGHKFSPDSSYTISGVPFGTVNHPRTNRYRPKGQRRDGYWMEIPIKNQSNTNNLENTVFLQCQLKKETAEGMTSPSDLAGFVKKATKGKVSFATAAAKPAPLPSPKPESTEKSATR